MDHKSPLILASKSAARIAMLKDVGVEFQSIPADLDETAMIQQSQAEPAVLAKALAKEKAQHISAQHKDTFVIGSDQILECEGTIYQKANSKGEAREKLKTLRDKTHRLISAVSIVKNGNEIWSADDTAHLTMRDFSDTFLEQYLEGIKDDILNCVGGYALEKQGAWLFDKIEGDYFTILGMPLLPLLGFLKEENEDG